MQVKGDVLPFCHLDEALGAFTLPAAQEIRAKRVIVATCGAAGLLREAFASTPQEPPITFTHVLIDEAGQVCACVCMQYSNSQPPGLHLHLEVSMVIQASIRRIMSLFTERYNACRRYCRKLWCRSHCCATSRDAGRSLAETQSERHGLSYLTQPQALLYHAPLVTSSCPPPHTLC